MCMCVLKGQSFNVDVYMRHVDDNESSFSVADNSAPPVEQTDDGWLNFTKISRNDSGWYKCYTKHTLGLFTSAGYFLFVRGKFIYSFIQVKINYRTKKKKKKDSAKMIMDKNEQSFITHCSLLIIFFFFLTLFYPQHLIIKQNIIIKKQAVSLKCI